MILADLLAYAREAFTDTEHAELAEWLAERATDDEPAGER